MTFPIWSLVKHEIWMEILKTHLGLIENIDESNFRLHGFDVAINQLGTLWNNKILYNIAQSVPKLLQRRQYETYAWNFNSEFVAKPANDERNINVRLKFERRLLSLLTRNRFWKLAPDELGNIFPETFRVQCVACNQIEVRHEYFFHLYNRVNISGWMPKKEISKIIPVLRRDILILS